MINTLELMFYKVNSIRQYLLKYHLLYIIVSIEYNYVYSLQVYAIYYTIRVYCIWNNKYYKYLHIVQIYRLMVTNTGNVNSTNVKLLHRFPILRPEYLNLYMSVLYHRNLKKET